MNNNYEIVRRYISNKYVDAVHWWSCPFSVKHRRILIKSVESMGLVRMENSEVMNVYKVDLNDNFKISTMDRKLLVTIIDVTLLKDWLSMGYLGALIFCFSKNSSFLITSTRGENGINIENL